jgi:hypothetical protein
MGDRATPPNRDPARHGLVQSAHSRSRYPELSTQLSSIYGTHSLDSMPALIMRLDDTIKKLRHDHITESTETGSSFMYNDIFRYVVHRRDEANSVDSYERVNFECDGSTDLLALKTREDVASINARRGWPSKILSSAFETSPSQTSSNARLPSRVRSIPL